MHNIKKLYLLIVLIGFCSNLFAQKTITGVVRDISDNMSFLPGVVIKVKDTNRGVITSLDGTYSIPVQSGDKELEFSFLGLKTQTISIGNKTVINVDMESDSKILNEVVVSAFGIKRESRSLSFAQQRVNAETMAEVRDQNLVSSLAGKVSGVQVTPPTSSTGSARIVIRGNSSFNGNNQPLFVVDGMQIDNSNGSAGVNKNGGLDMGNGAADINADDIESIDILKGPNAAALYGSRAANGVILITTKKAKDGKFKVSLSSNTMFRYISQWPDFQNAIGVGHMSQMVGSNRTVLVQSDPNGYLYPYPGIPSMQNIMNSISSRSNGSPHMGQPYIGLDGLMHTYSSQPNNIYDFYQKASTFTNNVAIEGGTKDNNYRASLTNFNADDVVDKQNLVNKNTLTFRFFNTLTKNLTLDSKITLIEDKTQNRRYSNQSSFNPLYMYTIMPRTMTLDELKYYKNDAGKETVRLGDIHNPYWTINETNNEDNKVRALLNFDLSYQLLPSLRATVKYGREYIQVTSNEFRNIGSLGSDDNNGKGFYREQKNVTDNEAMEWLLSFNKRIDNFSLQGTLGGSQQKWTGYWSNAQLNTLKQPGFAHISNSNDYPVADEGAPSKKMIRSIYASTSIGYNDYIYLDLTGRNDWSSTLPKSNRSYFYPSVGLSFIPTELLKISENDFYGKVRASYARVGNDTDPYNLVPYFNFTSTNIFNGYKYASLSSVLPAADLKPEITTSYEFGVDLKFLKGRVNADITYYQANSKNQILSAQMAGSSGYGQKVFNAGEIENKGWEASFRFIPIETKDFSWEASVNYTKNSSMVKSMVDGGSDEIEIGEIFSLRNVIKVGYPYGAMFGTTWLEDQQGRRMVNANGEPIRKENSYLGNFNPKYLLGIGNRFRFKDFDFYVLVDVKKGGKLYSGTRRQSIRNGVVAGLEQDHVSYWKRTTIFGDEGDYTWGGTQFDNIYYYDASQYDNMQDMNQVNSSYTPEKCDRFFWPGNVGYYADGLDNLVIYDASYIKLRELSVSYNLPKKLISKIKMTNARVSLVGRNLWIISQNTPKGLDPEAALNAGNGQGLESGSLPPSTTLGFDIKVTF